ncbi:fatty acid beta-hydroxylating cytochrome P450 [Rhodopirellula baltica SH28]|uniref:Fatty acid beta-hydroxylating cytochrome P450 n=1 Tax=Rhodopirellula baltica SH28 TaxID=993517 RepID=K5E9D0_RHOBT|nr:cytochrome P450 [Rhodopirellula baltica]EKK02416.1 fatty acid beta-hydroxylating cytochrome P450 [Rhodopirellula baltica SH28]
MTQMPNNTFFDDTFALARDPYRFISKQCERHGSDAFETRLLLQKVICLRGEEAAKAFYDTSRFSRVSVAPPRIAKTLFGRGGVQGMDGKAHRHRKMMFMSLLTEDKIGGLTQLASDIWNRRILQWSRMDQVVLYRQAQEVLTEAVCQWAGVPLDPADVDRRTSELAALFDYAGSIGPKHWWARIARKRNEAWLRGIIEQIRAGTYQPLEDTAAFIVANHRDLDGNLLDAQIAAVELNNILRPTVAVSAYIVQCAHALHEHPVIRQQLADGSPDDFQCFVQEVRRFYPYFPFAGAKVKESFEWQGYHFPSGRKVLLDLYGTNHDPRLWDEPESFRPSRFHAWDGNPFTLISQGGGDHYQNHRCPGEWIAIEQMKAATDLLVNRCSYEIPEQDLQIDMDRLPAIPADHFVMTNIQLLREVR